MLNAASVVHAGSRLLGRELALCRVLTGGQHAVAVLVTDGVQSYVVRAFPCGDHAVAREVPVLERIAALGGLVPHLSAYGTDSGHPVIVTSALAGTHPAPTVPLLVIAEQMAAALSDIHRLDGSGLRQVPVEPPPGEGRLAAPARDVWHRLERSERVLTHSDFWCGNALWDGVRLVGVVDWSGARYAPRGFDVAWCRQDLVLLGSPRAADHFLREYVKQTATVVADVHAWDLLAAARADPIVETWAPNYRGIDRTELTSGVLRRRFDEWVSALEA